MFWNKVSRDSWSWDKIPKDAEKLDIEIARDPNYPEAICEKVEEATNKLGNDSVAYIHKNQSYINKDYDYDDKDDVRLIILKSFLVAHKMLYKLYEEYYYRFFDSYETYNSYKGYNIDYPGTHPKEFDRPKHSKFDNQGIKEGAKNVGLVAGTNIKKVQLKDGSTGNQVIQDGSVRYFICKRQNLFKHRPIASDCRQRGLGDCWLQAALISILNTMGSQPIEDMFEDEVTTGFVKVRLYYPKNRIGKDYNKWNWVPKYYRVKEQIPINSKGKPQYNIGPRWVHCLQAAVAKSGINTKVKATIERIKIPKGEKIRNYYSLNGGEKDIAWLMLLGNSKKAQKYNKSNYTDENEMYKAVKNAVDNKYLVTVTFDVKSLKHTDKERGISGGEDMDRGLITGHTHSISGYEKDENGVKYIRLINPWMKRDGREYSHYESNGKKGANGKKYQASFKGKGDESFRIKISTAFRHLQDMSIAK